MDRQKQFEDEVEENIRRLRADTDIQALSRVWLRETVRDRYSYNFRWLGRPIIQYPQDVMALQEIVWGSSQISSSKRASRTGARLSFTPRCSSLSGGRVVFWASTWRAAETVLRVGDQKGNTQAVMEAAGVLKDLPYKIEWKEFAAAAPLLEALGASAIDTGLVGDAPFTFAAAANVPAKAIAAIRQSEEGLAILVPENSPIKSFEDLRGKKIATGRGSVGHRLILAALAAKGWAAGDVQLVYLAPSDAKVAYSQGSVDAWSTWEPYVSQEEVLFKARRVLTGEGLTPGLSFTVATPEAIRDKRAALEDFVSRLTAARAWSRDHVESYAETWGRLMNIPPAVAVNWLRRARIRIAPIDDAVVTDEQKTIELYFNSGLIKQKLDASGLVDRSFSDAVAKGSAKGSGL